MDGEEEKDNIRLCFFVRIALSRTDKKPKGFTDKPFPPTTPYPVATVHGKLPTRANANETKAVRTAPTACTKQRLVPIWLDLLT